MNGPDCRLILPGGAQLPALDELVALYDSVGWSAYTTSPETLAAALAGSAAVAVARLDGQLAGLARVVSDGHTVAYLQDVLVVPQFQGTGIGRRLVELVLEPFARVRQKVLLTDDEPGQAAFYAALGFAQVGAGGAAATLRTFVRFDA